MKNLDDLLQKFSKSLGRDVSERESIAAVIHDTLGFELRLEDISIKGNVIQIKTTPVKKNEIKLKEREVLEKSRERTKLKLERVLYL